MTYLDLPEYNEKAVISVTKIDAGILRLWVSRKHIKLKEQRPGRGKSRMYTAFDIVKIAILKRTHDFGISLSIGLDWANDAIEKLRNSGEIDWNLYLIYRKTHARILYARGDEIAAISLVGDPYDMRVSDLVEPDGGISCFLTRRDRSHLLDPDYTDRRPINEERRQALAQDGFHAEPVIIFPLGEIVNGALCQLIELHTSPSGALRDD